ncbi:hypothetical protein A4R26_22815 [Niastella populi]|uniref:Uncharacterized protein n=1 Tax=Niastella populi TaxID=550983 RepID=A0A1V9FKB7_9BACT|nr:hypothetical protein A4R26_22815 [Niastella populi]
MVSGFVENVSFYFSMFAAYTAPLRYNQCRLCVKVFISVFSIWNLWVNDRNLYVKGNILLADNRRVNIIKCARAMGEWLKNRKGARLRPGTLSAVSL